MYAAPFCAVSITRVARITNTAANGLRTEFGCLPRSSPLIFVLTAHFEGAITDQKQTGILFSAQDYIQRVDYTGRMIRPDKRGAIPGHLPPILQRLNLNQKQWLENTTQFEHHFYRKFGNTKTTSSRYWIKIRFKTTFSVAP